MRPRFWLLVMVVGFFAVSLYSGVVAYADFQTQNATDAGIITQAVASTAHGHVAPFYESYDCLVKSRCSFLLVHPGFVLYAAVPFYVLSPSTDTLFAVQSATVAAAAIPLYWLTRQVTRSAGKALLAAGMFLVWAPTLAGVAFSLHLECVLPLELISLAALWQAGRYRLGLAVAAVAFLTFEIGPIFTFLIGVFFLFPYIDRFLRREWQRWRSGSAIRSTARSTLTRWLRGVREGLRLREVRYLLVLLVASAAAYVALSLFMNVWGNVVLGIGAPPIPAGISGIFYNNSTPPAQSLGTILQSSQTLSTGEYWLLLYALLAFIPLLSPRALILSVPWIGWTFLTDSSHFTTFGREYAMVAAGPLFIGLAFGLQRVPIGRAWAGRLGEDASTVPKAAAPADGVPPPRRRLPSVGTVWVSALAIVVIANAVLMPINPLLSDLGVSPGAPFESGYFNHSLEISPAFAWVEDLVSTVPYEASIVAPSAIFPLLANYPHAYVLARPHQMDVSMLPFNVSGGPQFVLVPPSSLETTNDVGVLGTNLSRNVSNPLLYGMRGYVGSTTVGPIFLYEQGYLLPAQLFGPAVPPTTATYFPDTGLTVGPKGVQVANSSAPSGEVIKSVGGSNRTGLVWTGPDALLAPGNYTLNLLVAITGPGLALHPTQAALRVVVEGFGGTPLDQTLSASHFVSGTWTDLSFNLSLADPLPKMNIEGFLESAQLALAVGSVSLAPESP